MLDVHVAEFEELLKSGSQPQIEDFLGRAEGEERRSLLQRLIQAEFQYRRASGQDIAIEEYAKRFPELVDSVDQMIDETVAFEPPSHTSSLDATTDDVQGSPAARSLKGQLAGDGPKVAQRFGDYMLLEEIARGGMGVVYKARQVDADRIVALKMILSGSLASDLEIQRFYSEARAAANLDHPYIVPVFDVGEVDGQHYFSMGFVDGTSLADALRDNAFEPQRAVELLRQIAEAVHYANQQQVIHRDLKPANILLDREGSPRVTDFGLAKRFDEQQQLTMTGQVMGTPSYMPPEQAAGNSQFVGPATDVYSLGAILYQMLTGRPPFRAASTWETLTQVIEQEPVPPRELNPSIDRDLDTIVLKTLEKDPHKRYATAEALESDLRCYAERRPIQARRISFLGRTVRWASRNKAVATLLALLVCVSISVVIGSVVAALTYGRMAAEQTRLRTVSDTARAEMRETLYVAEMNLAGEAASTPSGIGQVRVLLDQWIPSPDAQAKPDMRGWEWYFLYALSHQERPDNPILQTGAEVFSVTDNGDGLVAIGNNRLLRLLDITRMNTEGIQIIGDWEAHDHRIDGLSFGPRGKRLASASFDGTVKIWDARTQQLVTTLEHRDPKGALQKVTDVSFHPDGKLVASHAIDVNANVETDVERASLRIWDLDTRETRLHTRDRVDSLSSSLAFSPDGSLLAAPGFTSFSDFPVMVWDVKTGKRVLTMPDNGPRKVRRPGHKEPIRSICWSPDGQKIATTGPALRIWNAQLSASPDANRLLHTKSEHGTYVNAVSWSPDGRRLASAGDDYAIRIWDSTDGQQLDVLVGHANRATVAHWVSSGRLISGCASGKVRFWDQTARPAVAKLSLGISRPQDGRVDFGDGIGTLHWRPDGQRIAASVGDWALVWNTQNMQPMPHVGGQKHLCWSHDGRRAASLHGDEIRIWDAETTQMTHSYHVNSQKQFESWKLNPFAAQLSWSPTSETVVLADYKMIWQWDIASDEPPRGTPRQGAATSAWRPNGLQIASANGHAELMLFEAASEKLLAKYSPDREPFDPPLSRADHIAWHPDESKIATAHANHAVKIWDTNTWEAQQLEGHTFRVHQVAWSPDGRRLASAGGDKTVKIWDPVRGGVLLTLGHEAPVIAIAWAPGGQRLGALDAAGLVKIYDAASGYRLSGPGIGSISDAEGSHSSSTSPISREE